MLHSIFRNTLLRSLTFSAVAAAAAGCSMIYDDLPECPANLSVNFRFNYTLDRGEVLGQDFAEQIRSVNVWAFDEAGRFVWSGSAEGERLADPDFKLETTLGQGTYDFVAWCGISDNEDFSLATYTPASKEELEVKLNTIERGGLNVSSSNFKGLYHGERFGVVYTIDHNVPSISLVTIPLIKDTNDIAIMLVNENGTVLDSKDFTVTITYADSWLAWDNAVMPESPAVTYDPWAINGGVTTPADGGYFRSTLLYELSTSRLISGGKAMLNVVRNTDGERIIPDFPLIEYFEMERGERFSYYGSQEYLDRRSDYSALFVIGNDLNWYMAAGIYINGWAVVPEQNN